MTASHVELERNPVFSTTTTSTTNDGKPIHTLDVNAVVSLGNVTVTVASDGLTGAAVPTSAGYIGWSDGGTLRGVSVAKPLPIQGDLTGNVTINTQDIELGAVELKDGSSNNRAAISASGALSVDGSAVTQPVSAAALPLPTGASTAAKQDTQITSLGNIDTSTSGLSRAEDSASASGDKGVGVFAIQLAAPGNLAGTDGDYANLQMSGGRLWASATIDAAIPAGTNVIGHVIIDSGSTTVVTGNVSITGATAADAVLTVSPVTIGGRATNTNLAPMSADGDVVNSTHDLQGRLVTIESPRELVTVPVATLTTTTETTIIAAGGANIFIDLYGLHLANTSATGVTVTYRDATGGGTARKLYVPPTETRGFHGTPAGAIPQGSANGNWTVQLSGNVSSVEVTALGVKRK